MFIAMWKMPKWMNPDVTRRYHWWAGMGVLSKSAVRPCRMALPNPRSACNWVMLPPKARELAAAIHTKTNTLMPMRV